MSDHSDDYKDWKITLPFSVPHGDTEGVLTEAIYEAALEHAPAGAAGMVASADADEGKVRIVFTLVNSSRELADEVAAAMRKRIQETVFSGDEASVSVAP